MNATFLRQFTLLAASLIFCGASGADNAPEIGNHRAVYDSNGILRPWTSWRDALAREMKYYAACPIENGYPRFVTLTFMDSNYAPSAKRQDMIPAMQHGMGIISYLKYYAWTGRRDLQLLAAARVMGDYLI